MSPPTFLTPSSSKWQALLTTSVVSSNAKVLLCWLVFQADPRTGVVDKITQAALAEEFPWSAQTVRRALDELAGAGMIDARLPQGRHTGGEVRVLAYYDVMQPTKWLNRQRSIGGTP